MLKTLRSPREENRRARLRVAVAAAADSEVLAAVRPGLEMGLYILPGEFEMEALAAGALRVLRGQEKARVYR